MDNVNFCHQQDRPRRLQRRLGLLETIQLSLAHTFPETSSFRLTFSQPKIVSKDQLQPPVQSPFWHSFYAPLASAALANARTISMYSQVPHVVMH